MTFYIDELAADECSGGWLGFGLWGGSGSGGGGVEPDRQMEFRQFRIQLGGVDVAARSAAAEERQWGLIV